MDGASDKFLPRPALAEEQDRSIEGRDAPDLSTQGLNRGTDADKPVLSPQDGLQREVLLVDAAVQFLLVQSQGYEMRENIGEVKIAPGEAARRAPVVQVEDTEHPLLAEDRHTHGGLDLQSHLTA